MRISIVRAVICGAASIILVAAPVSAHEHRGVGHMQTVVGWLDEPAFADTVNGVSFRAAHDEGPITGAKLKADVRFGSEAEVLTLTLNPAVRDPGHYKAEFIPTRAGSYTFRIYGTLDGEAFNQTFTSGPKTFDEISSSADLQFPKKDPSRGELADKAVATDARIADARTAVTRARDKADVAWILGIVGIALGAAGLILGARTRKAA